MLKLKDFLHHKVIIGLLVLFGLYLTTFYSYDLFHSLAEAFAIVIACGIFMLVWNSRQFWDNNFFLVIGVAYLFIGGIDFLHTISYRGLDIFRGYGPDLPTQLWIVARYFQAAALMAAPLFIRRKPNLAILILVFTGATILAFFSIFVWGNFPHAYIDGSGLTSFKIVSEYIVSAMFIIAVALLYRNRKEFDDNVLILLSWSMGLTVVSELFFTVYVSVFDIVNMFGHLLRIVSYALLYEAVIVKTVVNPFDILFRGLKENEIVLKKEIEERKRIEAELLESTKQRDDFLFQTIHDLRSPTNVIQLILENHNSKNPNRQSGDLYRDISLIERANSQMIKLIGDLFMIASGEKTEIIFKKQKINLESCIQENLGQLMPLIKEKNILIEHRTPLVKAEVIADSDRVNEVLINILDNAIKYNKFGGRITITYEKNGNFMTARIQDTGIGVAPDDLPKIFKPYYRSSYVKNIGGTGLGLYIVKKLVEKMNGRIEAESKKGGGTAIIISLPLADAAGRSATGSSR